MTTIARTRGSLPGPAPTTPGASLDPTETSTPPESTELSTGAKVALSTMVVMLTGFTSMLVLPGTIRYARKVVTGDTLAGRRAFVTPANGFPSIVHGGNGLEAPADARLAAHFIRRADVPSFLADSHVKHTVHHGANSDDTYFGILRHGPRVKRNKRSVYGQGFYTAMVPGGWGYHSVEVAVRTTNPLVSKYRTAAQGYDALIIPNGGTTMDWVVGLTDDNIKLVVDLPGTAPGSFPNAARRWNDPLLNSG